MKQVDLFLQSYCYKHHYLHAPGYDVFAYLERTAADGFTGVSFNLNGPYYRQLSGTSIEHRTPWRRSYGSCPCAATSKPAARTCRTCRP